MQVLSLFLGIIAVLVLILLLYVKVEITLQFEEHEQTGQLVIEIIPVISKLRKIIEIKHLDLSYSGIAFWQRSEHFNLQGAEKKRSKRIKISRPRQLTDINWKIIKRSCKFLVVERFDWYTRIGLADAAYTAIVTGILWAIKGNLAGFFSSRSRLEEFAINITPDFSNRCIASRLNCIFKMRIVHIMFIGIYALFLLVRGYMNGITTGRAETSH